MKTPQEEAEEWVTTMTPTELRNVIAEFIVVARAAVLEGNYQPDVKGEEFGYWISEEDFEKLEDALQALRATGKVEL